MKKVTFNERGQVLQATDNYGLLEKFERDTMGNALRYTDDRGNVTTNTFDERGNRLTFADGASAPGAATVMTYDGTFNVVTSVTDELGNTTKYQLDAKGNVHVITKPDGSQWTYTYYPQGLLWTITDPYGRKTVYTYDSFGRVLGVRHVVDNSVRTFDAYDTAGNAKSITDENGNTTIYVYDAMNRVRKITYPTVTVRNAQNVLVTMHPVETFIYDNAGNQTSVTDPDGNVTLMTYDTSVPSRMLTRTDGAGGTMTYKCDTKQQLYEIDDQLNHPTTFVYDLRYRLIKQTDALGYSTIYGYDGGMQPTSSTDARGFTTTFEYDARGRLVRTIDPYGSTNATPCQPGDSVHTIRNVYDGANNVVSTTDQLCHTTTYVYDVMNRVAKVTQPDPDGTSGQLPAPVTRLGYDVLGDLTSKVETDTLHDTGLAYCDASGNVLRASDAFTHAICYGYDNRYRLATITDALGGLQTNAYDLVGNRIAVTDQLGRWTDYHYDALDRLTSITLPAVNDPNGAPEPTTTQLDYDAAGNLRDITDELGRVTEYRYDGANRRATVIDAKGEPTTMAYDHAGNVTSVTDALGRRTDFHYDDVNRLTETLAPNPTSNVAPDTITKRTYDEVGNLATVTDPLGNETDYAYDKLNRLTTITRPLVPDPNQGGALRHPVTTYIYDAVGNRTQTIDALGNATDYAYDSLNRLVSTTDPAVPSPSGSGSVRPVTAYAYDSFGNLVSVTNARGFTTTYGYDVLNRRTTTVDAFGSTSTTTYDAVGNARSATDELGRTTTYDYDGQNRLLRVTRPAPGGTGPGANVHPVVTYGYDAVGNRTQVTDERGNVTRFVYDELNRPVLRIDALGHTSGQTYDAVGRVASTFDDVGSDRRVTTYAYDRLDRVVSITQPDPDGPTGRFRRRSRHSRTTSSET